MEVLSSSLLVDTTSQEMEDSFKGHEFISSRSYGKYLFSKLDNDLHLIMHFEMTGYLHYFHQKSSPYARMLINFQNGYHLAFEDARKFGKLGLTGDPDEFLRQKGLGPDALKLGLDLLRSYLKVGPV